MSLFLFSPILLWGGGFILCVFSGTKKKNTNPNFLVRIFSRWGRGLPRERVGAKKFDTSPETRDIKLFGRDIPGFCRDIPGAPEKFEKKKFGFNFRSLSCFRSVSGIAPHLVPEMLNRNRTWGTSKLVVAKATSGWKLY